MIDQNEVGAALSPRPASLEAFNAPRTPTGCPVSQEAAAFDPFETAYQHDPAGSLRWSREDEPVFYNPSTGYWIVTRYADVKTVFRDNVTFSPSIALEKITPTSEKAHAILESYDYKMSRTLVNEDEPEHMPRRRALMAPFTPEELTHHEQMVRSLTRDYVDRFVDAGRADLVDEMLWQVPLTVAMKFLGVPEEDMATLREYSIAHTVNTWGRPRPEEQETVAESVGKFWQYAGTVLEKLRSDPSGRGWMPYGIRVQQDLPEVVTDSYLHSMMMAGIVAAHETTANAAANALHVLLSDRSLWTHLCEDPSLIPNAIEECLRLSGSVAAWRRIAMTDTTIGGVAIPAGSKLLIVNASANHDERHFVHADDADLLRPNAGDHLTFGFGSHQCMGKNLARMELQIFLEEFTTRLPHMRLAAQEITYLPNTSFRGPEHLWVEWDPQQNPERVDRSLRARTSEVYLGAPAKAWRTMNVASVDQVADGVVRLELTDPAARALPRWTPGSHLDIDFGEWSRQYSLCGSVQRRDCYEIAVLEVNDSRGGSRFLHDMALPGTTLRVRGPRNHFMLDGDAQHSILVAGGIGITPIVAMADELATQGHSYEVHYVGRSLSSMAFVDRLRADHGDALTLYPRADGNEFNVDELLSTPRRGVHVYGCGPRRLLDALIAATGHWPDDILHIERFSSTMGELDPRVEHAFDIELTESGGTVHVPADKSVLDALRAAGVEVDSDCEEGLCGTCEVRVTAGTVDHRDVVLSKQERATNTTMMTCCSRAHGQTLALDL